MWASSQKWKFPFPRGTSALCRHACPRRGVYPTTLLGDQADVCLRSYVVAKLGASGQVVRLQHDDRSPRRPGHRRLCPHPGTAALTSLLLLFGVFGEPCSSLFPSRTSQIYPPRAACYALRRVHADGGLIGAWNPMLCPIWGFRCSCSLWRRRSGRPGKMSRPRSTTLPGSTRAAASRCGSFDLFFSLFVSLFLSLFFPPFLLFLFPAWFLGPFEAVHLTHAFLSSVPHPTHAPMPYLCPTWCLRIAEL